MSGNELVQLSRFLCTVNCNGNEIIVMKFCFFFLAALTIATWFKSSYSSKLSFKVELKSFNYSPNKIYVNHWLCQLHYSEASILVPENESIRSSAEHTEHVTSVLAHGTFLPRCNKILDTKLNKLFAFRTCTHVVRQSGHNEMVERSMVERRIRLIHELFGYRSRKNRFS